MATEAELNAFFDLGPPAVAFGGGVFLVVFHEIFRRPYAKRVSVGGALLDAAPIPLPDLGTNTHHTSVRFDGTDFVVAYGAQDANGIHVVRVRPNGTLSTEQASFVAPYASSVRRTLRLSAECGGDVLAVFSRAATTANQANERAFARLLGPDLAPASPDCALPAELAPDADGTGGSGAAAGAAGALGSGGAAGAAAGGTAGSAGRGVGANGGATAGAPASDPTGDGGGCACKAVSSSRVSSWPLGLLAFLVACARRRWRLDAR